MAEWWTASHTSGSEQSWSIPIAKDVLDRYTFLYQEKYGDDNVAEHPAFDKKLWKQVSMERNVGSSSRKQGLGGLDPYYSEEFTNGSSAASTVQYQSSTQASASFDPDFFSSQLSQMTTTLEEGLSAKINSQIMNEIHALEDRLVRLFFIIRRYKDEQEVDLSSNDEEDYEEYICDRRSIHASSSKGKGKQVCRSRK